MYRFIFARALALTLLAGLFTSIPNCLGQDSNKLPNLIVVMVDDMGYEGVSCFGNPYFETPEIDRLAAEGMRLTDFHSSGTVCSPTRAGLLTGRYQQRAGIEAVIHPAGSHLEHRKGLQREEVTFAELLSKAGYHTALIGKWHQGYPHNSDAHHPQNHGFGEFVGYHSGNIDFISHVGDHSQHDWWYGRQEIHEAGYSTHLINEHAVDFVRRQAASNQPFCLYVAHEAIHNPVQVPGDPVRRTEEGWDRWKWQDVTREERIAKYRGMTLPIDEGMGRLRRVLEENGIAENTLILFFSDNGPAGDFPSGSPNLRGRKGSVYEGGHKVPAIAWWPGHIAAGTQSDEPIISLDVMPTLLQLAGIDVEEVTKSRPLDGVNLTPVLLHEEPLPHRPLYWASLSNQGARSEAMRLGEWKLVVHHPDARPGTFENPRLELYNLERDPAEKTNLAEQETQRMQMLWQQLQSWYADTQATSTTQPGGWLNAERTGESQATSSNGAIASDPSESDLIQSITKTTLRRNRDGRSTTWFHPRACRVPDPDRVLMTMQSIEGSDYFGPVHWTESSDGGVTWSEPVEIPAFSRIPVPGHPGLTAGVCDVTPQYHPQTNSVIALGHVVFYKGPKFSRGDQLARYPVYAIRGPDGRWSERKILKWDDPRGAFIYSNNCGQRVVLPNGDVMMSFTFGPEEKHRSVAGVRCTFDGNNLEIAEVGPPLTNEFGRGLLEPSLTQFHDRFWLTIRAEDGHGYVATSSDGLNYEMQSWKWDDGEPLEMSTTQQHWLTHSDALYLVYTRRDQTNDKVIRWRSPLWVARVDPERGCLIRSSERVVLPLVGDGRNQPDGVALMGNFDVTNVSTLESWVTVGEWLPRRGAVGNLLLSKIKWQRPNAMASRP